MAARLPALPIAAVEAVPKRLADLFLPVRPPEIGSLGDSERLLALPQHGFDLSVSPDFVGDAAHLRLDLLLGVPMFPTEKLGVLLLKPVPARDQALGALVWITLAARSRFIPGSGGESAIYAPFVRTKRQRESLFCFAIALISCGDLQ